MTAKKLKGAAKTSPLPAAQKKTRPRWNGRLPITSTLAISIGLLMLIAVGSVLGIGVWLAQKNTFTLLSQNAHQAVSAAANQLKTHLKPAEFQTSFIAERIANGEVNLNNRQEFATLLTGALAAAPQVEAIIYIDTNLQSFGAGREDNKVGTTTIDYSRDPIIAKVLENRSLKPGWGPPVWQGKFQKTYLNHVQPVIENKKFKGVIVAVVSIQQLSQFVADNSLSSDGQRFLLYGRDQVLAHWLLGTGYANRSSQKPLPALAGFSDPVLSAIWKKSGRHALSLDMPRGTNGHVLEIFNDTYIFIYQNLVGFGPKPIIVGTYFQAAAVSQEIQRMKLSFLAGLIALLISLIAAVMVGRRIARPIVQFSAVTNRIRSLDISKVGFLPNSIFRELNDQSSAFNAMLRALLWFEVYVPKKIVERLVKQGTTVGQDISAVRDITVMFTDIVGFSSASEELQGREVAAFINQHFTLVAACIEAEKGTVDKFIGDSVMAFWGAPEDQDDQADRACRTALAIQSSIHNDNLRRRANGEPPIRLRIGIHSGPAVVGNIGAPGRLNYTIIGDTVNIGQRLEQLAKEVFPPNTEVAILISSDCGQKLSGKFDKASAGRREIKGRAGKIEIYKLI